MKTFPRMSETDEESVVRLLEKDLFATTGVGWERMIRHSALTYRDLFNENAEIAEKENDDDFQLDAAFYLEQVVEDVQQTIHDLFVDTSWPRCPKHSHHPMWLKEGWWTCESDGVAYARLGELDQLKAG